MLTDSERKIIEILSKQHLLTKSEISHKLSQEGLDSADQSLSKLSSMGYVEKVESLGICYVITQKGMRFFEGK